MDNNYQKEAQPEEIFDEELQAMGIPFEDETAPREMPHMEQSKHEDASKCESREGPGEAKDTCYAPVYNARRNAGKHLIGCVKWAGICGGISMLLWWFQVNDLMAIQAAYPCIVACGVLGGFGVGMHARRGHRYE